MTHTDPARHSNITIGIAHAASASAGASFAFTAEHSAIVGVIVAAAGIITTAIAALGREWFWLRALRRPGCNLDHAHNLAGGSITETERLMRLLADAENNVLAARGSCRNCRPSGNRSS